MEIRVFDRVLYLQKKQLEVADTQGNNFRRLGSDVPHGRRVPQSQRCSGGATVDAGDVVGGDFSCRF